MDTLNSQSLWKVDPALANTVSLPLGDLLSEAAIQFGSNEALVYACHTEVENVRWSFEQLNQKAEQLAAALLNHGYQPGDKVAIWGPNNPEWILLEYAFAKAGLTIVALNPLYKKVELEYALITSNVTGIFHADKVGTTALIDIIKQVAPTVKSLRFIHSFSEGVNTLLKHPIRSVSLPSVNPDSVFMIQYTSGTTGQPKAAQLSHRSVATIARNSYQAWGFGKGDRVCHGFPLFHVGGSGNSTPGSALVGTTTLPLYIFKAERTLDILEQEKCTGFLGVPTMLTAMLEHPSFASRDFSSLRLIIAGGATVPISSIKRYEDAFGVEIINGYGQTETCGVTCSTLTTDSVELKSTTSGRALAGISLKVVDSDGHTVAKNTSGELCYQGPGKMLGYSNAQAGQNVIDDEGWLHTGDLATMDDNGYIRIVGRAKEMIIRGGENLSPSEIEAFLLQHDDILEAAVLGLPDAKYGEEVCAILRMKNGSLLSTEKIRSWCSDNLSRWKVPKYIYFTDHYPKTPSGKIQKFLLKEEMVKHFNITQKEMAG